MTLAGRYVGAAIAVARRDALLYLSYRWRLLGQIFTLAFTLTVYYYISRLVTVGKFKSPDEYYAFVTVGLVIMQVLQATLAISGVIRQELVAGTFERMVVSPFGPVGGITALLLFPFLESLVVATITLTIGAILFGLPIAWSTAWLALPVALIGSIAFSAIGLVFAGMVLVVKQASAGANLAVAGFSLIAGLYFPISLLPSWVSWTSNVQPITPGADLLRHLLVGTPLQEPAWVSLLKLVGFAVVLMPLAVTGLHLAVRTARRTGTIIEY